MIEFLNENARIEFHLLPIDRQMEFVRLAEQRLALGEVIVIEGVYRWSDTQSEVAIRIDKKFDLGKSVIV